MSLLSPVIKRQWFRLRWPHEVKPEQLLAALLSLNGASTLRRADSIVLQATGQAGRVVHHLAVPEAQAAGVRRQLEASIPGLAAAPVDLSAEASAKAGPPFIRVDRAWRAWLSSRERPLELRQSDVVARSIITALASAEDDEQLVLQWVLGPVRRPVAVGSHVRGELGSHPAKWLAEIVSGPSELDGEGRTALAHKQGLPGWRATLHLGVKASGTARQLQLLGRLASAVRVAQGPGVQFGFRSANPSTLTDVIAGKLPFRRPLAVNVGELKGLAGWPLGITEGLPVDEVRSRLLPPSPLVPNSDRVGG